MKTRLSGLPWFFGAALILAGCGGEGHREKAAPLAPVPVRTVLASTEQWPGGFEATGTVRARTAAQLSSRVMAYVREVRAEAGTRVRQGDLLVLLDNRDLDAAFHRAEAGRDAIRGAQAEAGQAQAAAKAQLDLASATFTRMQELFDKKSISNQEYDEAAARRKAAQAAYEMAASKVAQARAQIAQADQEVESAAIMRGYAEIHAPFSGVVTARSVEPGAMATPGAPLLTVEREGVYRLEAAVEESRAPALRAGAPVTVTLDSLARTFDGRISEIVPALDPQSHAYTVKIDLPALAGLRSGMFGRAQFPDGTRSVIAVPAAAVTERGQLQSVWIEDGGIARTRLITTGRKKGEQFEILSGVAAGEHIIYPVPPGLADGAPVHAAAQTSAEVRP